MALGSYQSIYYAYWEFHISTSYMTCTSNIIFERQIHKARSCCGVLPEQLATGLVSLLLVNMLHKIPLVLEHITLTLQVQRVVAEKRQIKLILRTTKEKGTT